MKHSSQYKKNLRVGLVYDRVNRWGGAERILLALHELFPEAPLFTSVYHATKAKWAKEFTITTSFLQNFPLTKSYHELFALAMPIAFESFSFDQYDLVISVTSEAAKGIITKPTTKHICYCLTPTRYLWSGYTTYFEDPVAKMLAHPAVSYLRSWDLLAAHRPDHIIAISKEVQKRIATYYQRDALVIYPPSMLPSNINRSASTFIESRSPGKQSAFRIKNATRVGTSKHDIKKGYFLVVSRLSKFTTYKRVDLAIQACNALKLPLKVIGTGSWKDELRKIAGP